MNGPPQRRLAGALIVLASLVCVHAGQAADVRVLDDFHDASAWRAAASDDVSATVAPGTETGTLRLAFDFRGHAGYAMAHRALPLDLPDDFEISLRLRGDAKPNDLQIKLVDASGDNVWWFRRADLEFPRQWQTLHIPKRQIDFAWGPSHDHRLRTIATIEIVVSAGHGGGAGSIEVGDLTLRPLPPAPDHWPQPVATASQTAPGSSAAAAVDGSPATAWHSGPVARQWASLTIDLGAVRSFGGLSLSWLPGHAAPDYDLQYSDDGTDWRTRRKVRGADRAEQRLYLPDSEARYLRLTLAPRHGRDFALVDCRLEPSAADATPNDFFLQVARGAARGTYPRAYSGEQTYWTVVGTDGGEDEGLLSEDGAFELRKAAPSLEPRVTVDGVGFDWADVSAEQSLMEGYLPIPSVTWSRPAWQLRTTAFADGSADSDYAIVRYDYVNRSARAQRVELAFAIRPFQVDPPTQFLNGAGGVAPIHDLVWDDRRLRVNGAIEVVPLVPPDIFTAATFDAAPTVQDLLRQPHPRRRVEDESGFASGAFVYRREVPPGGSVTLAFVVPWTSQPATTPAPTSVPQWLDARVMAVEAGWHERLDRVSIRGPESMRPVLDTLRTALAHILINRDGPALQPGSRSYERSWIRDGAMMSEALLRLGESQVARQYLDWYSGFLFQSGKVPCCVDYRGADPVPENDSNGEFVWLADELDRYTHDRAALDAVWPKVTRALGYLDELRLSERTDANLRGERRAFYGLVPASISHEGYSAKPMHSYWDDFWTLAGLRSGLRLATERGDRVEETRLRRSYEQFHDDLHASLAAAMAWHGIDFLPGSAELGDFDATSTTIALAPAGDMADLPQDPLRNTFERYWRAFVARRDGATPYAAYTPYELRIVGSFVRLGWPERANELLDFFMRDRRPAAWNQWAEVVGKDLREPRFVGDMPHGWVASDFIRSVLDMLAYEREADEALVLAAGVDARWLDGPGIAVDGLRTPWGPLSYSLRRDGPARLRLHVDAGLTPPGGVVLAIGGREYRFRQMPVDATIDVHAQR